MIQILRLKGKLLSLNEYVNAERTNRFAAAKLKKTETERVMWECRAQKIKKVSKIDEVYFLYYHDRRGDYDGYEFYQKFVWDGLKEAGIIPNDTQAFTPAIRLHKHFFSKEPRLIITLITYEGKSNNNKNMPRM